MGRPKGSKNSVRRLFNVSCEICGKIRKVEPWYKDKFLGQVISRRNSRQSVKFVSKIFHNVGWPCSSGKRRRQSYYYSSRGGISLAPCRTRTISIPFSIGRKNDVTPDRKASQARRQFVTPPPESRHTGQLGKSRDDGLNEFVRRCRVVLGNVKPDSFQVRAGCRGNAEWVHEPDFFIRFRPARPMSSANCITFAPE